ncbi:WD40 repeat domain-containing protein [Halomonas alkalicola]|uniref:WD40 repeat domain-containing protein n=1 Tax=Halomonas alkalicola TaxID=1930622 RepID=UPI00265DE8DA|nr:WD40 repeat domain-containing protein [Halomonas alkalicola]
MFAFMLAAPSAEGDAEDESVVMSERWVHESAQRLTRGERLGAIAAALKAFPATINDGDLDTFAKAHLALYAAVNASVARFPLSEGRGQITSMSPDSTRAVKLSHEPDGRRVIELLNLTEGTSITLLVDQRSAGAYSRNDQLVFSEAGHSIAVGGEDGRVLLFDPHQGTLQTELTAVIEASSEGPYPFFLDISFSPSGNRLVAVQSNPLAVTVWDLERRESILQWQNDRLDALAPFPRGSARYVVANVDDEELCLGVLSHNIPNLHDGQLAVARVRLATREVRQRIIAVNVMGLPDVNITCSGDGRYIAASYATLSDAGSQHLSLDVWAMPEGELAHRDRNLNVIGFDPEDRYLALHSIGGLRVLDLDAREMVEYPFGPPGFEPEAPKVVGEGGATHYANPQAGILHHYVRYAWPQLPMGIELIHYAKAQLDERPREEVAAIRRAYPWRQEGPEAGVIRSPADTEDDDTYRWVMRSEELLKRGERKGAIVAALKGAPEASEVAHRALYEAVASRDVRLPLDSRSVAPYLLISPDGKRVVVTLNTPEITRQKELWDVEAGRRLAILTDERELQGVGHSVPASFSPDGQWLAVGVGESRILLFNGRDGARLAELSLLSEQPSSRPDEARAFIRNLAFSADSRWLLAVASWGSSANIVQIWEVPEGALRQAFGDRAFHEFAGAPAEAQLVDATWAGSEGLCLTVSQYLERRATGGRGEFRGMVVGLLDIDTQRFRRYGALSGEGQNVDKPLGCRHDGSILAVGHSPRGVSLPQVSFWREDGQEAPFLTHPVLPGAISFDPHSEHVALVPQFIGNDLWVFLDLAAGTVVEPPFALPGYVPAFPSVHVIDGAVTGFWTVVLDHRTWIWTKLPVGPGLIEMALAELDEEALREVESNRQPR